MTPFLIVLVVMPVFYLLYRQRAKSRTSRQILEPPPAAATPVAIEKSQIESPQIEVLQSYARGNAQATSQSASDEAENVVELQQSPVGKEEIESCISNALDGDEAPACEELDTVEREVENLDIVISSKKPITDGRTAKEISQPEYHIAPSTEMTVDSSTTATSEITDNLQAAEADVEYATQEVAPDSPIDVHEEPNHGMMTSGTAQHFAKPSESETGRPAQRYRPPPQKPPRSGSTRARSEEPNGKRSSESALEIFVHLTFDRSSFCTIGFLPKLAPELGEEVDAMSGSEALRLLAQEDWYQDIKPEDMGERLCSGIELRAMNENRRTVRWQLKGRDFYVLAGHPRASGYLSTSRLLLGRTDVVLCVSEMASEVESVLAAAGCEGYTKIGESLGVPGGWVGFRGVLPTKALPLDSEVDRLYALKPAPDIEIDFEGGVRLQNSIWLAGYPPRIKIYGQLSSAGRVLIDGKEAERSSDGSLTADGYDQVGEHSVYCEGQSRSRTYSVEAPPDSWDRWTAYRFDRASVCGPLVQLGSEGAVLKPFTIPMSNPVLVGSEPGQIFQCSARSVGRWRGFVPFDVVWALPAQPLTSDKRTARIIQFADKPIAPLSLQTNRAVSWCNAILDASRKGLRIESDYSDSSVRWREYRNVARKLQRARR